jgi:hypothetical protein
MYDETFINAKFFVIYFRQNDEILLNICCKFTNELRMNELKRNLARMS